MTSIRAQEKAQNRWWLDVLFILLTLVICTIATLPQLEVGDFRNHISWTAELAERHYSHLPHTLYQQLTLIIKALVPFSVLNRLTNYAFEYNQGWYYQLPGLLTALGSYLATILLLQRRFLSYIRLENRQRQLTSWIFALICLIVDPILLFTLGQRLIIGYIPANVWHSPTYTLLRPLALWVFFFIVDSWKKDISWKQWLLLSALTGLSMFAKPNFVLSFIPAFGLVAFFENTSLRKFPWKTFSALGVPAVIVLLYQYYIFTEVFAENQIFVMPFKAALSSTGNFLNLLAFYSLSILFPILVGLFSRKRKNGRFEANLVWTNFAVALVMFLVFVELPNMESLNFLWGPMLAVFLLFVYSIGWLLQNPEWLWQRNWQTVLTKVVLGLHIISGFVYTLITVINPGRVR